MNLAKRASLLILPVVIASYSLVGWFVYERECNALTKFEQSRLEQRADHLKFSYTSSSRFIDAYLNTLIEGGILANYLGDVENIYREKMFFGHLKAAVNRFEGQDQIFASLTLFDSQNKVRLYTENSVDPFAEVAPEQRILVQQMADKKQQKIWQHTSLEKGSIIQHAITLDPRTLAMPILFEQHTNMTVVIAVKPARYDELLLQTTTEYDAKYYYSKEKVIAKKLPPGLFVQIKLSKDHVLLIKPSNDYLNDQLRGFTTRLLLVMLLSIFFTFTLLLWLIRKFITGPIALLDNQLTQVIDRKKDNIALSHLEGEVGRLGHKFYSLYAKLNNAFQESYSQARIDSLTQLPNRVSFNEDALEQLLYTQQQNLELSIVYVDIDNFKFVNDKYGHEVGDELLKSIAIKFKNLIGSMELGSRDSMIYRLSGDEFVILLPKHDREDAQRIGEQVLGLFTHGFNLEQRNFSVSASLGVACFPEDGKSLSQLISNADLAMYQAKKSGKNRMAVYSNELAKNERKLNEIETLLKDVNLDQEFTLFYMPIIDGDGRVKGCEALLRWFSPQIGQVSPADFIPVAEESGVFEVIDLWVIEQAFKDFKPLQDVCADTFNISINVSSAELNSERFIESLEALCIRYSIPTHRFMLEITETFAMEQGKDAIIWLNKIHKLGFKIAIDDFGTGYTSLMQMVDYPVDVIKFDKQLVERITQVERQHLAKALVDLCHLQGISVVAEGIETVSQSLCLEQAGCDFQQGFLIAKPMSFGDLQIWLEQRSLTVELVAEI